MHRHKPLPGQFERLNARRERAIAGLRRKMIQAAMAGGKSGFAVAMQTNDPFPLRIMSPRPR